MPVSNRGINASYPRQTRQSPEHEFATFFHTECVVCGRPLRVMVQYLGHRVICEHCGGCFTAFDPAAAEQAAPSALDRADQSLTTRMWVARRATTRRLLE